MGDLSPVDVVCGLAEGDTAIAVGIGGRGTFSVPSIAAWCVAAVPVGSSAAAVTGGAAGFAGGPVAAGKGGEGLGGSCGAAFGERRQRSNIPSMHSPTYDRKRAWTLDEIEQRRPTVTQQMLCKRADLRVPITWANATFS
jgi:hypothetical protein